MKLQQKWLLNGIQWKLKLFRNSQLHKYSLGILHFCFTICFKIFSIVFCNNIWTFYPNCWTFSEVILYWSLIKKLNNFLWSLQKIHETTKKRRKYLTNFTIKKKNLKLRKTENKVVNCFIFKHIACFCWVVNLFVNETFSKLIFSFHIVMWFSTLFRFLSFPAFTFCFWSVDFTWYQWFKLSWEL